MSRLPTRLASCAGAAVVALTTTGCGSDDVSRVYTADPIVCDNDFSSFADMNTIERIGGLRNDDFSVKLAQSTQLGVVALVDGDAKKAFEQLNRVYGVTVVATQRDDGARTISGFAQVRELVAERCPTAS